MLWFDVEKRYNTTPHTCHAAHGRLWFDVEKRYNTTVAINTPRIRLLWFDVEKRYNTTSKNHHSCRMGCGLM